jgi:RNA polymerase sigma-70 factor (ECF subfamily)
VTISNFDEKQLVELCRTGDSRARKRLYELYAGRLMTVCLRYSSDRTAAEDVLHDGFLKIYSSLDKFTWKGEGSLKAWMERVMANEALQALRHNEWEHDVVESHETTEEYDEPEEEEIATIPEEVLLQFISELPTGYRTVFNLHTFEEMSHKEIALLLNINEKSSASQLARAKMALAQRVKEWIRLNS